MGKVRPENPAWLTEFKALSFDVYSTLIDEKGGMFTNLQPLLNRLSIPNPYVNNKYFAVEAFHKIERQLQASQPSLPYNKLLSQAYTQFASSLDLPSPSEKEILDFGSQVGAWPAFPDTVAALQYLSKYYKLVPLSNIDNDSIAKTISGPLAGVNFDAVYTAQNIGSYKPDLKNFNYLIDGVKREFGVEKSELLHVAQSLPVDQVPARTVNLESVWIAREPEEELLKELGDRMSFTWKFETLGELVDAVREERKGLVA